jgi:single-strand DNA-binding protein
MNVVVVIGTLSSPPRTRTLASGSQLVSYEVTTEMADGSRLSVPVVWLDPSRPSAFGEGDAVAVVGVVRRRFFRAGGSTQSRTEIEAGTVARADSARAVRALRRAAAEVGEAA